MAVIRVQIDQVTLTGVPRAQRDRVLAAFQRELTRLLALDGPNRIAIGDRDRVTAGPPLAPTTDPRRLGRRLARSVHATVTAAPDRTEVGPGGSDPGSAG